MTRRRKIIRDTAIVFCSISIAGFLLSFGLIDSFLNFFENSYILTSFISGILFTSIFTTAIGTAAFIVLGGDGYSPIIVGIVGGLGALFGDLLIFKFIRQDLQTDISYLLRIKQRKFLQKVKKIRFVQILLPLVGIIVIASPLPDELGIMFFAISHVNARYFSLLSLLFNSLGIGIIVYLSSLL